MKYKVMLTGRNNTMINDFFTHMDENFESMTTSERYQDIFNHLKYFEPDIFVFCLNHENNKYINQFVSVRERLAENDVPLAIIGSEKECNNFLQYSDSKADLVLYRSLTAADIMSKMMDYLKERQRLKEERIRAEEERLLEQELLAEAECLSQQETARRKHILVVDDNPMVLKLIKRRICDKYDVATARSGKIAMKFLQNKTTDLILLDYVMPEENGPEILEQLRANDATKDIPVVFLTGVTERDKIQKALALKPQGYLLKPIDHDKLIAVIEKHLG